MKSTLQQPWWRALAIAVALIVALALAPTTTQAQSCDPTRQSCVCSEADRALGRCGGGGGGGGGTGGGTGGQCTAPPGGNPTNDQCGSGPATRSSSGPSSGAGNPINLVSGNKYQQEVDLPALPGVLGLELVRHYNSLDAHRGLTGANWRSSYEAVLYDFGRSLQIVQADGRRLMFERPTTTQAASNATHALCTTADPADGQVRIEQDAQGRAVYHWRWADGRTLVFGQGHNGGHPLQSITAASGEQLTLSYAPGGELIAVRDPQGRSLRLLYDAQRQLSAIQTPVTELRYRRDAQHRLTEVSTVAQDKTIVTRRYHYEAERQSGHANALTGVSLLGNEQGKTVEQRLSTYAYDARGRATLSTKADGIEKIEVQYIEPPLPRQHKQSKDGEILPAQFGITVLTNSLGQKSQIKSAIVAGSYRLVEFTGAGCSTCPEPNMRYGYNAQGQLIAEHQLDAKGKVQSTQRFEHDGHGRLTRQGAQRFEYADTHYPDGSIAIGQQPVLIARPSVVAGKEHTTRIDYNEQGQPTSVTDSGFSPIDDKGQPNATLLTRTTRYSYSRINGRSVLTQIDGPLANGAKGSPEDSDITRIEWDAQGSRAVAVTRPMNLVQRLEHDDIGRLIRSTDADSVFSQWFYAASSITQPSATVRAGTATGYAYDAQGRVAAVADASGRFITLHYDAAGRLTTVRDAQGYAQKLQLDAEGKPLVAGLYEPGQDQPLRAAYRLYDEQQRLKASVLPDGRISTWRYDDSAQGQGRLIEHVDGDEVMHLWRHSGLRGASAQIDITPDGLVRASLQSPRAAALASNAAAPAQVQDDFGRTVAQRTPDHGSRFTVHDAADRVVLARQLGTDATLASTTEQDHDAAGRLTERRTLDARGQVSDRVRWQWHGAQLRQVDDTAQTQTFERDSAGRVIRTLVTLKTPEGKPLAPITLRTSHDPLTGEPQVHTLADERELRIERHAATGIARQLSLASPAQWWQVWKPRWSLRAALNGELQDHTVLQDITAHPFNGVSSWRHGNGVATAKQFDIAGRLTQLNVGAANNAISAQTLAYKTGPRVRGISDDATKQSSAFDYNGFGLLKTGSDSAKPTLQRTAFTPAVPPTSTRELDAMGRVVVEGARRYAYNANGQLAEVREAGRLIAAYRYNSTRQRVSKTVFDQGKPATTYFLWHQQRLVAELSEDGRDALRIDTQYLYLKDGNKAATPIAKLEAATAAGNTTGRARLLAVHADHRGQPMAMSDEQQRVVWRSPAGVHANAWGYAAAAAATETFAQQAEMNLSLPGQYRDAETGLHDNWHRTYNPRSGRYLQPDPLGYPDGPDPYLYAGGDPVNKVDPTGLYQVDTHYYMTFFLAMLAGLDVQAAQTIALATQGIDDNDDTRPLNVNVGNVPEHRRRLLSYHFVLIDSQVDPATGLIRTGVNTYGNAPTSTNVNNPLSFQLDNLLQASQRAPTRCARFQFLGEYLHAFEDTFSHRDQTNRPYPLAAGLGHGLDASDPDYTYNHGGWQVNADRTLAMELAVFQTLRGYGSADNSVLQRGVSMQALTALLRQFNAIEENDGNTGDFRNVNQKVALLDAALARWGYEDIELTSAQRYSIPRARNDRSRNLCGLNQVDYPGTILPSNCPRS